MEPKDWIAIASTSATVLIFAVTLLANWTRERGQQDRDDQLRREQQEREYSMLRVLQAVADFAYKREQVVVFVDGSPHHRDYVQAADEHKRRRLKALPYRVVVVQAVDPETGLNELAARIGRKPNASLHS